MKTTLYSIAFSLFLSFNLNAQSHVDFGIKGGVNLTFFKIVEANFGPNVETEVGYYGGVFVDFYVDESFSFQPEVLYIDLGDFKFLNAPLYAKYQMANNFDIMLGPSLNYFFDFFNNKFKVRGDVSMAYHITNALDAHIKYTLGFQEISPNGLFFGIGYRL
ncbi:MAG: outer membrane beta-barrel protein [Psychroserpens sp.]|uniref:outer membrane beta-barrel protein n=1 Tax=Psychroserpens sp. TaxID=2020870 RepID=UPI00300122A7